ncbi:adenosylcobinamide-GDP ribazoletransferase [Flavihumibacter petaseus]|uniref:Adenosylcobinamide-GDP ribazoletransferase n=1 Tax=Flavihumibacter petaseus NBRC 106054 TaxID=1220578 RepID=A0A0E9N5U2_9BACT|nr:adenosylcobinamide-GDP ribazoletransferase [Flavihumibacter petaseus]GAO45189.1 cobalamin synthase [Flavihumibacter petaseus NBRC 106054]
MIAFLRREYHYFLTAIQFLTRIQLPASYVFQAEYLQHCPRYFPLAGQIVAAIALIPYLVVSKYLSEDLGLAAYMVTTIWLTGAFHEDGWADCCDAFGGGYDKERILTIMKDSRLGTYGTVGLIAILTVKFLVLKELPAFSPQGLRPSLNPIRNYQTFILLMLAAHGCSRFMGLLVIRFYDYAGGDLSKSKPLAVAKPPIATLLFALILAAWPIALLSPWMWLTLLPMIWATRALANYFKHWIGGYTGDCLGTVQQVTEIVFYLAALIVWRYIQ